MDIAGMRAEDFSVELDEGILKIAGERTRAAAAGKRHYHAMEVQIGRSSVVPAARRRRSRVDPRHVRAGFLEIRLAKQPPRSSGAQSCE